MMSGTAHGDAAALERMQLEPEEMQTPPRPQRDAAWRALVLTPCTVRGVAAV